MNGLLPRIGLLALACQAACAAPAEPSGRTTATTRTATTLTPTTIRPTPAPPAVSPPVIASLQFTDVAVYATPCGNISSMLYFMDFTPDGRSFIKLHDSGDQCIWKVQGGRLLAPRRVEPPPQLEHDTWHNYPSHVPFSGNGKWGITFSYEDIPLLWRLGRRGAPLRIDPFPEANVHAAALAGDLAVFEDHDGNVALWSLQRRRALTPSIGLGEQAALILSADGRAIAMAGTSIAAWDLETGKVLLPPTRHARGFSTVQFTFDNRRLIAADSDGRYFEWDLPADGTKPLAARTPIVSANAWRGWLAPGGEFLLGVADGAVSVYRVTESPERTVEARGLAGIRIPLEDLRYLEPYFSRAGDRVVLAGGDEIWFVYLPDAKVEGMVKRDDCGRAARWALGPDGLVVSHASGSGLCLTTVTPDRPDRLSGNTADSPAP